MDDRRISPRRALNAVCRLSGHAARVLDISHEGIRLVMEGSVTHPLLQLSWYLNGYHLERPLRVRWAVARPDGRVEVGATFSGNPRRDAVLQKFVDFAGWTAVAARRPTPGLPPTGLVRHSVYDISRRYKARLVSNR
ncbi:MAG: hypothetical protein ACYCW6_01390 [Candidatus Xenobia bacterium]